jgi:hypothetical protein
MTYFMMAYRECSEALQIRYKITVAKTQAEKKRLRELLKSHRKSCPVCEGITKVRE